MVKTWISKEKPAALALFARGLKEADSKKGKKWGAGGCDILFVPAQPTYSGSFYKGTLVKYARALGHAGCTDASLPGKVKELTRLLQSAGNECPAGVLVSVAEPQRYDELSQPLPLLAVRGQSCAAAGGNWVYRVSAVRTLQSLPAELKLPGLGKAAVSEAMAEQLRALSRPCEQATPERRAEVASITAAQDPLSAQLQ